MWLLLVLPWPARRSWLLGGAASTATAPHRLRGRRRQLRRRAR